MLKKNFILGHLWICLISGNLQGVQPAFENDQLLVMRGQMSVPITVLSLGFFPAQRDAIDLARRWGFMLDAVGVSSLYDKGQSLQYLTFYWPALFWRSSDEVADMVRQKLQRQYDVILMTSLPEWNKYPSDITAKITGMVEQGTVLVVFSPAKELFASLNPKQLQLQSHTQKTGLFNELDAADKFNPKVYRYGRGLIVEFKSQIDYRQGFLFSDTTEYMYYEYCMARISRFLKNLTQRQEEIIKTIAVSPREIHIETSEIKEASLALTVSDINGRIEFSDILPLASNLPSIQCRLPLLPNGRHYVFCTVIDREKKTLDWGATWFMQQQDRGLKAIHLKNPVTKPMISSLSSSGIGIFL